MPAARQHQTRKTRTHEPLKAKPAAMRVAKSYSKARSTNVSKSGKSSKMVAAKTKPTYDEMGYEIDPVKVAKAGRRPRQLSPDSYMKMLDDDKREGDRKAEIMGTPRDQVSAMTLMAWKDRVARELGKPYHKVVMQDFEEVHRRGIKFHPDEFVASKMSKDEQDRISKLATGSAFRK